jgi:hypothetical protein
MSERRQLAASAPQLRIDTDQSGDVYARAVQKEASVVRSTRTSAMITRMNRSMRALSARIGPGRAEAADEGGDPNLRRCRGKLLHRLVSIHGLRAMRIARRDTASALSSWCPVVDDADFVAPNDGRNTGC